MRTLAKVVFGIIAFVLACVAADYLAGAFFLIASKKSPAATTWHTFYEYWFYYHNDMSLKKRFTGSAVLALAVSFGVPLALYYFNDRNKRSLHGDARFANDAEVARSGLFAEAGILVGKWRNRFLMFGGLQFVLLAAPTRTGKGVGIVIPNLLSWNESLVVLDIKLENFLITSKYRAAHGHEVYVFNPFAENSHRYNPLGYVRDDPNYRVSDILGIGYSLYPGVGKDSFFDDAARNLFLGLTLYLCETPTLPRTIGELLRQSSGKGQGVKVYIQGIINKRNFRERGDVSIGEVKGDAVGRTVLALQDVLGISEADAEALAMVPQSPVREDLPASEAEELANELRRAGAPNVLVETTLVPLLDWDGEGQPPLSMECVDALNRFTGTSDNTLTSILASFNVPLTNWVSPIFDAATSANDFDLREVRRRRMTIYVGIPANMLAPAKLLMNVFFSQLLNLNMDVLLHGTPEVKYRCLLMMDEFTAPGRINILAKSNAFIAGYGLPLLTIIQAPSQLAAEPPDGYGREVARTLRTNHACQILYTPREPEDAKEYSEMLGYYTFKAKGTSRQLGGKSSGGRSESESDQRRALMLPQELREMPLSEQIIDLEQTKAIRCTKICYYADHVFIDRLKSVSPSLAALDIEPTRFGRALRRLGLRGKSLPTKAQLEAAWGSGELSVPVPRLDLDLHVAVVQSRVREVHTADIDAGIDLRKLALDFSSLSRLDGNSPPEDVKAFVNDFFDAVDAGAARFDDEVDEDGALIAAPVGAGRVEGEEAARPAPAPSGNAALSDSSVLPAAAAGLGVALELGGLDDFFSAPTGAALDAAPAAPAMVPASAESLIGADGDGADAMIDLDVLDENAVEEADWMEAAELAARDRESADDAILDVSLLDELDLSEQDY